MNDLFGMAMPEPMKLTTKRKGYAATPGSGPENQTCGACLHFCSFGRYCKCDLMRTIWTGGKGTDILKKSPSCSRFERGIL